MDDNKNKIILLMITMSLLAGGIGFYHVFVDNPTGANSENARDEDGPKYGMEDIEGLEIVLGDAMWERVPPLENLVKEHSFIIIGKVERMKIEVIRKSEVSREWSSIVEFRTLEVLKNSSDRELKSGDPIRTPVKAAVIQTDNDKKIFELRSNPLPKEDEVYLLFLDPVIGKDYNYTGYAPFDRYLIRNDKIYGLDQVYPDRVSSALTQEKIKGRTLENFSSIIKNLGKSPN